MRKRLVEDMGAVIDRCIKHKAGRVGGLTMPYMHA